MAGRRSCVERYGRPGEEACWPGWEGIQQGPCSVSSLHRGKSTHSSAVQASLSSRRPTSFQGFGSLVSDLLYCGGEGPDRVHHSPRVRVVCRGWYPVPGCLLPQHTEVRRARCLPLPVLNWVLQTPRSNQGSSQPGWGQPLVPSTSQERREEHRGPLTRRNGL